MNIIELNRNTMNWPSGRGMVLLRHMDNQHMRNCLELVKRNPRVYWNSIHRDGWISAFEGELRYRMRRADGFIQGAGKVFPNSRILKDIQLQLHI